MKKIIFLLIILGCLLFCGCAATADIEYGISHDNTAYTEIKINVDAPYESALDKNELQSRLRSIETYYRTELGFKSDYSFFNKDENTAYLTLTKSVPADSFEEAFDNLKEMLCNEQLSVFTELNCELSDTRFQRAYRIGGRVDMHKVLDNAYNSGISKAEADYVKEMLETCAFSVTLSLPENTGIYRLSHTEATEISHEGKLFCVQGRYVGPAVQETAELYFGTALIGLGVLALLFLAGTITGIALIKKGKKKAKADILCLSDNGENINDQKQDQDTL